MAAPTRITSRRAGVALFLLLAGATARAAVSLPVDYFPLVRGSTWTYTTGMPQGEILVDALNLDRTAGRDPRAHPHPHDHDGHEPGHDDARTSEPETHVHLVLAYSQISREAPTRPVRLQREWLRRDAAGNLLCGLRTLNQEEVFLDPPQLVLPADPKARKTWTWTGTLGYDTATVTSVVEAEETVRVPAGSFETLRVRIETKTLRSTGRAIRWYAAGVGLVKEEAEIAVKGGDTVRTSFSLASYRIGPPPAD